MLTCEILDFTVVQLMLSLFWDVMQHQVAFCCGCVRTTCWSHLQGSDIQGKCQNGNVHGYVGTGFIPPSEDEHFIV
jgi:hypothetical protein